MENETFIVGATEKLVNLLANSTIKYPPYDYGSNVIVFLAAVFVTLLKVEENKQLVSFIARINMTWNDPRLAFDPEFIGRTGVILPPNSIWTPRIEMYNCLENEAQHQQVADTPIEVRHDGYASILWYSNIEIICAVDVAAFPFDHQWCAFAFSAGMSDMTQIKVIATNETATKFGIPEWQILDVESYDSNFTQYGRTYGLTEISFHLKRNPEFYIYLIVLPTFVVTVACISAMLLPLEIDIGDRVNLGIAGLLSQTFMLSVIVGELPRTPGLPLIGKWVIIEMFFCLAGLIIPMIVEAVEHRLIQRTKKKCYNKLISGGVFILVNLANVITSLLLFSFPNVQDPPTEYYTT